VSTSLVLRGGRVITPGGVLATDVAVSAHTIAAVARMAAKDAAGAEVVDLDGRWVLPGFIDVHVHGGGGAQCNATDPAEVATVARFHAQHGTTALLATTVAAPVAELVAATQAIRAVSGAPADGSAEVLGAHLEGPFLSPLRPGAMEPGHFLDPDAEAARSLLEGDGVRWMTVAPERPGGLELVRRAAAKGVVIALGHSDATYDEAAAAAAAGARVLTHAFNAMRPLHHREPGVLGAALDLPEIACEVICDGVHVDAAAVRLLMRLKGPKGTILITDAIEATGLPDGGYRLGGRPVTVRDGRATLPETDTIAGSTLTMDRALRNAVSFGGVTVEAAARMAATTPAELLGIAHRKGVVAAGRDADLVILDDDLALAGVLARGRWVRRPNLV
jgi:N-acetylglucosamine-6-phosphate deacetylase